MSADSDLALILWGLAGAATAAAIFCAWRATVNYMDRIFGACPECERLSPSTGAANGEVRVRDRHGSRTPSPLAELERERAFRRAAHAQEGYRNRH